MTSSIKWRPTAPLLVLGKRAAIFYSIREFFRARNVLEVDTPILAHAGVTDPHVQNLSTHTTFTRTLLYLQTSPEYAMKRLLAAGSGSIYQLGKVFRDEDVSARHQIEFTMLEWYRVGFSLQQLIEEATALVNDILECAQWRTYTYKQLFWDTLNINPHTATIETLQAVAQTRLGDTVVLHTQAQWLDLLFTHAVEPALKKMGRVIVTEYPAAQAALAQTMLNDAGEAVAKRFEMYIDGIELANGYQELQDANEQRSRFEQDQHMRRALSLPEAVIDEAFLAAMAAGLPPCAGVALGVDRLVMLATGVTHIAHALPFGDEGN